MSEYKSFNELIDELDKEMIEWVQNHPEYLDMELNDE